jgi:ectoine hydroxylase-related dioxygenase (phytanoyl-CoA dioxygenase family)
MSPGEALLVLGSTWHAGGANKTKDVRRPQNTFFFTRGMYRPEVCHAIPLSLFQNFNSPERMKENPYLTYLPHEVLGWSEKSQALAGMNRVTLAFDRTNYLVPSAFYAEAGKRATME